MVDIFLMETMERDACYCRVWQRSSPYRPHFFR
jgi:hypothetical protein